MQSFSPARKTEEIHPLGAKDAKLEMMREALGVIPVGAPAVYRMRHDGAQDWMVRRDGESEVQHYPSQEAAIAAIRLAVLRCSAYQVILEEG